MKPFYTIILFAFMWHTIIAADVASSNPIPQKDYLESLFNEVEVAKTAPPDGTTNKLYDELVKDSVAYGVLNKYPNLQVGNLAFRPLSRNATHKQQIMDGQNMILKEFSSNRPLTYKDVADTIDRKINDPNIRDIDWVLMSNAFRTLQAPGGSHKAHLLGDFIAEYILLGEIKKQESKPTLTAEDRSFLSALYYDLSQLYQAMYKNDENLFDKSNKGQLYIPIDPIYRGEDTPVIYDEGYDVPYDTLVGRHLDLLGNSLLYDPYDDLAWTELVGFGVDLMDPSFDDQFSDVFWDGYFPYGFTPFDAYVLQGRWADVRGNMRNNRNFTMNRTRMDRGVRNLSRNTSRTSPINTSIRNARSRTGLAGLAPQSGRSQVSPSGIQSRSAFRSHPTTSSRIQSQSAARTQARNTARSAARSQPITTAQAQANPMTRAQARSAARASRAAPTTGITSRAVTPRGATSRASAPSRNQQFPKIYRSVQQHAAPAARSAPAQRAAPAARAAPAPRSAPAARAAPAPRSAPAARAAAPAPAQKKKP